MSEQLWGGETTKAIDNFPVSGEPVPAPVVHWLGRIKANAARTNADLGLLDREIAEKRRSQMGGGTTSSRSTSSRPAPAPPRT